VNFPSFFFQTISFLFIFSFLFHAYNFLTRALKRRFLTISLQELWVSLNRVFGAPVFAGGFVIAVEGS
jgi:hypothetical protein